MVEKELTILIPTYNQGKFISETINSILNQTIMPNEILISNNHSTDTTDLVLAKYYNHKLIKIFKPESHLTMIQNWNFLVKNVKTKYFSIIKRGSLPLKSSGFILLVAQFVNKKVKNILIKTLCIVISL